MGSQILLQGLLVAVFTVIVDAGWQNLSASVTQNAFGSCTWSEISPLTNIQAEPNHWRVMAMPADDKELESYAQVPMSLTKSNPMLGRGLVKGIPKAELWANSTGNSWQLAKDHPRNDKKNCVRLAKLTGETAVEIYDQLKKNVDFYVIKSANALIHETGVVGLPCGYFQPIEGCETIFKFIGKKWWKKCHNSFRTTMSSEWPIYWKEEPDPALLRSFNTSGCMDSAALSLTRHRRVFVIAASWDNNYHHFIVDSLSRLSRSLDFLIANPDVKIHIRRFDQYAKIKRAQAGRLLRTQLIRLIGLHESRFISGQVMADEVFIPRAVKCNYPLASALELRLLAKQLLQRSLAMVKELGKQEQLLTILKGSGKHQRRLVLQHRLGHSKKELSTWRHWTNEFAESFRVALQDAFPGHEIIVVNTEDEIWGDCVACQVLLYSQTDVLIGLHGAGLTNIMFMPAGSLMVEIMGQFDGRMLPLCGYHGPLGAVFGVHHYLHYYDWKGNQQLDVQRVSQAAFEYHRFLNK